MNKFKRLLTVVIFLLTACSMFGQVQSQIDNATKAGNTVFLLVKDKDTDVSKEKDIINEIKKNHKKIIMVELDRSIIINKALVDKYQVQSAQTPLVLCIGSNGAIVGGLVTDQITKQSLNDLIPTPKYSETVGAISSGKSVLILVSDKTFMDKAKTLGNCLEASGKTNNPVIVDIDLNDAREAKFLKQLNVKTNLLKQSTIIAINKMGQVTGSFDAKATSAELVAACNKIQKGCGSSCKPGKCN